MIDLSKPTQTQGQIRTYLGGGKWSAPSTQSFAIAPAGPGGFCQEFSLQAGHKLILRFPVSSTNRNPESWEFANDANGNKEELRVAILGADAQAVIATYEGRHTGTDQPFGQYLFGSTLDTSNKQRLLLPAGQWCIAIDTKSGNAAKVPLWHTDTNN